MNDLRLPPTRSAKPFRLLVASLLASCVLFLGTSGTTLAAAADDLGAHVRIDLAGAYPGLSGPATVSLLTKSLPGWHLPDGDDRTLTDALANDCLEIAQGLSACDALLLGSDPRDPELIEIHTRYQTAPLAPKDKFLTRLRVKMGWSTPRPRGWEDFLAAHPKPQRSKTLPRAKALVAFASSDASLASATGAAKFKAALWTLSSPNGVSFEIAAVAALDAKGRLVALACETARPEKRPPSAGPRLP